MAYGKYHAWQLKRTNRFTYQFPWFPLELDRLMGANKREHGVTLFQVVTETNSATWFKCHNKNNTRKATHTICHLSDVWKVELISKDNQPELTVVSLTNGGRVTGVGSQVVGLRCGFRPNRTDWKETIQPLCVLCSSDYGNLKHTM